MTPLHWVARTGAIACARWLLTCGADVNAATVSGRVPLHLAAASNKPEMVWLLGEGGGAERTGRKGTVALSET